MKKLLGCLSIVFAIFYYISFLLVAVLLMFFMPLMVMTEVQSTRALGFATSQNVTIIFIGICGIIIGLSMLIPPLRLIYKVFPWFNAFIRIIFINMVIVILALSVFLKGYDVNDLHRHDMYFRYMIAFLLGSRLLMSIYFKFRPIKYIP